MLVHQLQTVDNLSKQWPLLWLPSPAVLHQHVHLVTAPHRLAHTPIALQVGVHVSRIQIFIRRITEARDLPQGHTERPDLLASRERIRMTLVMIQSNPVDDMRIT